MINQIENLNKEAFDALYFQIEGEIGSLKEILKIITEQFKTNIECCEKDLCRLNDKYPEFAK